MRSSGRVRILVSEEEENVIVFDENPSARYAVVCDPIDGSSNLDAGVSVGTIFGVFKLQEGAKGTKEDLLRPGTELVASGFTMYGASAMLVITMKGGAVNGFTLDNALGEFILTHPDMRIPKKRAIYSVNEGNSLYWEDPVKEYVNSLKYPGEGGKPYSARYIGSMVADAYRTLLYGGIFAYPADKKSPKGKLRILYECAPMALVFENGACLSVFISSCNLYDILTIRQPVAKPWTAKCRGCWKWNLSTSMTGRGFSWEATTKCRRSLTSTKSTQSKNGERTIVLAGHGSPECILYINLTVWGHMGRFQSQTRAFCRAVRPVSVRNSSKCSVCRASAPCTGEINRILRVLPWHFSTILAPFLQHRGHRGHPLPAPTGSLRKRSALLHGLRLRGISPDAIRQRFDTAQNLVSPRPMACPGSIF
jgi:hypothetical protein